jgi:hypothetical protein
MILRDMYCSVCSCVSRDVPLPSLSTLTIDAACDECRAVTPHLPVCNGGIKTRFRQQDWPDDPAYYRGQCTCTPATVEVAATGEKVADLRGGAPIDQRAQFVNEDRRAERRDRKYHDTDRKKGRLPLTFDGGKHVH